MVLSWWSQDLVRRPNNQNGQIQKLIFDPYFPLSSPFEKFWSIVLSDPISSYPYNHISRGMEWNGRKGKGDSPFTHLSFYLTWRHCSHSVWLQILPKAMNMRFPHPPCLPSSILNHKRSSLRIKLTQQPMNEQKWNPSFPFF